MLRTLNTRIKQNIHLPLKSYSPWSHVSSTMGLVTKPSSALFCFLAHETQQQFDYYSLIVIFHFLKSCLRGCPRKIG